MTTENHAKDQAAAQLSYIREMLAALNCDYERLEELRDSVQDLREEFDAIPANAGVDFDNWARNQIALTSEEYDEYLELTKASNGCESQEDAETAIKEGPLSVQVRSGWYTPGETPEAEEFEILLCTGGPAVRIMGELDEHNQPSRAYMQYQDWGTPWTDYYEEGVGAACLEYAQLFWFGE